ncbi:hypothetical protein AVEN_261309-1 [Araneus ventricosus]|uniref:Uncharacterized protein n=1 Tax=Araneus ventricosus TaxID=182803 RepID=A0A4Y2J3F8_ARAVE|nr:hypothetical protein AVEN_261309-1 [Araneus ventricosus]
MRWCRWRWGSAPHHGRGRSSELEVRGGNALTATEPVSGGGSAPHLARGRSSEPESRGMNARTAADPVGGGGNAPHRARGRSGSRGSPMILPTTILLRENDPFSHS